jgi:predicted GNAT family acetyltransferase
MKYEDLPLTRTEDRFELVVEGHTAFIEYEQDDDLLALIHTEVPAELGGKGVGAAIVEKTFEYAKEHNLRVVPICPFVGTYLKRHPEWESIVVRDE